MTAAPARSELGPKADANLMTRYAKRYNAGAFATPTWREIAALQAGGHWHEWPGVVAASRRLTRDSVRRDFTGRPYTLRAGSTVITHIAAEPGATVPDLGWADVVYAYVEDPTLTAGLRAAGRAPRAVRVSASSEIIAAWGRPGAAGHVYPPADARTIGRLPLDVPTGLRGQVTAEIGRLRGWTDDFPFYSDGSWAALSLRGFDPADPAWGIKPSEMSRSWWAEHPEAKGMRCDWTVLADRCPGAVALAEQVADGARLERVRLLQMAGRGGRGGRLLRHSDVTDRAAGVADGKIARFHVPIVTDPAITMTGWNLQGRHASVHLPPWTMWYLDARKPHAVDNPTGVDRVHLVVDVVADPRVRAAIARSAEHVL